MPQIERVPLISWFKKPANGHNGHNGNLSLIDRVIYKESSDHILGLLETAFLQVDELYNLAETRRNTEEEIRYRRFSGNYWFQWRHLSMNVQKSTVSHAQGHDTSQYRVLFVPLNGTAAELRKYKLAGNLFFLHLNVDQNDVKSGYFSSTNRCEKNDPTNSSFLREYAVSFKHVDPRITKKALTEINSSLQIFINQEKNKANLAY